MKSPPIVRIYHYKQQKYCRCFWDIYERLPAKNNPYPFLPFLCLSYMQFYQCPYSVQSTATEMVVDAKERPPSFSSFLQAFSHCCTRLFSHDTVCSGKLSLQADFWLYVYQQDSENI